MSVVHVVGAGVAGAAAAIDLAERGHTVRLYEKTLQDRHKVCGEFLSHEALGLLRRLGVDPRDLGAVEIDRLEIYAGPRDRGACVSMTMPFVSLGLSRWALDGRLLQLAEQRGVELRRGQRIRCLSELGTGPVFWATGKLEAPEVLSRQGRGESFVGFKRHLRLPSALAQTLARRVELHLFDGGYAGLSEIEGGCFNFCFIVKKSIAKSCGGDWQKLLATLAMSARLQEVLNGAEWLWDKPVSVSQIPYGHRLYRHREAFQRPFFALGDQMAVIPSLAGDGVSMALVSSMMAVEVFQMAEQRRDSLERAQEVYHRRMQEAFDRAMKTSWILQRIFLRPELARWVLRTLGVWTPLPQGLVRLTRCRLPRFSPLSGGGGTMSLQPDATLIRRNFGRIAKGYDRANDIMTVRLLHRWRRDLVRWSGVRPGDQVLDIATGTGDLAFLFQHAVGRSGRVVGVDFTPEMLAVARQKELRRSSSIQWRLADALALPFEDRQFDVVSISYGIRNVVDYHQALKEMFRVLKPGGRVMVLETGAPQNPTWKRIYAAYFQNLLPHIGGLVSGHRGPYVFLQKSSLAFPSGEVFCREIEKASRVRRVEFRSLLGGVSYLYRAEKEVS